MFRTSVLWTALCTGVVAAQGCGESPAGQSVPVTAMATAPAVGGGGAGTPGPVVSGAAGRPQAAPTPATGINPTPATAPAAGSGAAAVSSSVPASSGAAGSGGQVAQPSTAGMLAVGAAGNSGASGAGAAPAGTQRLPCDVAAILFNRCRSCHGMPTNLGAPMSLVTFADLQKPAVTDPTKKVHELVATRIQDTARPMPPAMDGKISVADKALLTMWSMQGAPALASGAADCPK